MGQRTRRRRRAIQPPSARRCGAATGPKPTRSTRSARGPMPRSTSCATSSRASPPSVPTAVSCRPRRSRWTVSADGLEYTFRLRENLRWSNGDPLRAADFVAGLRRLVDPATASPYAQVLEPVQNAAAIIRGEQPPESLGVSAPDDRTVVIRLQNPAPYLLGLLAQPGTFPVHGPSLAQHGGEHARPGRLVSNGAFALTDWVVGSHVVAERNRALLERRRDAARQGALPASLRCRHRVPPVPCRRDRRHLHRAAAAVRVDPVEPAG